MLENLRVYALMGWPLFPCSSKDKSPLTAHGFKDASTNLDMIQAWHERFPGCAWGAVTSAKRGVFDVDAKADGLAEWQRLVSQHGDLPPTPRARTGGGGLHYWLRWPAGSGCRKPAAWCDRKAEGGYVIVPPSKIDLPEHQGRAYAWEVRPWEVEIAEAPAWLVAFCEARGGKANPAGEAPDPWVVRAAGPDLLTHPGCDKGKGERRRPTLCSLVGVHLARGDSPASIDAMAEAWANRCSPPLEREEWEPHVARLIAKEKAKAPERTPVAVCGLRSAAGSEGRQGGEREGVSSDSPPPLADGGLPAPAWPSLAQEAYHGLLGQMLRAVEPQTEAHPAAVLLGWLACFGSVVGRSAWVEVGPTCHHPALFVGLVGVSSARKGMAFDVAVWPFERADPQWARACVCRGVGSAPGLIERVRDE
jgi:hypothetical protein